MNGVNIIYPQGTNSTMFTSCCDTAICNDEKCCPRCGKEVIGADVESAHERGLVRWRFATRYWDRNKRR